LVEGSNPFARSNPSKLFPAAALIVAAWTLLEFDGRWLDRAAGRRA
jgi:hypothetical protein